jgi:hypothetical protein
MHTTNIGILDIVALCITFANRLKAGSTATERSEGCERGVAGGKPEVHQTLAFCGKCAIFCEGAFPAHKILSGQWCI